MHKGVPYVTISCRVCLETTCRGSNLLTRYAPSRRDQNAASMWVREYASEGREENPCEPNKVRFIRIRLSM
jgi:hypothetical protein